MFETVKNYFKKITFKGYSILSDLKESKWETLFGNSKDENRIKKFSTSAYVYACVNKRAEKVSQTEFYAKKNNKEIKNHPLVNLLYKPNSFQTKEEFFYLWQVHKDLTGCAYIWVERDERDKIKALHLLPPHRVRVIIDTETASVKEYKIRNPNGTEATYKPSEIIASRYPSPLEYLEGHSPLTPAALSVQTEEQLSIYHYSVLKNGGRVEGIIKSGNTRLTKDQVDDFKEQWAEKYAGAEKSGVPLVLYGEMEYQNLGLTPTDLSYIDGKKMTRDDILMVFGVPKVIVSQTDGVNYANAKVGLEVFLSQTIQPLVDSLVGKLNEELFPEDVELCYVDFVPKDIESELKRRESGLKNGYLTINEVRALDGLSPLSGGDEPLVPFNYVKLSDIQSDVSSAQKQ